MYPMYYYDPTYFLVLIGVVICLVASAKMNSTFNKYARVRSHSGMTGREAAEAVLHRAGIYDVRVEHVAGNLTDHYDPRNKTVNLSPEVFCKASVAAVSVAAHECGHAIQDKENYREKIEIAKEKLKNSSEKIDVLFENSDFTKLPEILEEYDNNVEQHYQDFLETNRIWNKLKLKVRRKK